MRPFASRSPDPRDCRVMVVGINPAKPLDFWDGGVWNSVLGYVGPDNVRVTGGPGS